MSEHRGIDAGQEEMDRLLRRSMGLSPPPLLSPGFDRRLARVLAPRRLSSVGRLVMALYAAAALAGSVWMMRSLSIGWPLLTVAVSVPLLIVTLFWRPRLRRSS